MMGKCNIIIIIGAIVGVVLIILGAVLGFKVLPDYIDNQIKESTELKKGTEQYDRFEELPFPLDFKVYFFTVDNPIQVMIGVEKPKLTQRGPYHYQKTIKKENIIIDEGKSTIEYSQRSQFKLSDDSIPDSQLLTVLNVPLMSVMQIMENFNLPILNTMLENGYIMAFGMETDTLFMKLKVSDYTFDGYKFCEPSKMSTKAARALCGIVRIMGTETMEIVDRTISFSFLSFKNNHYNGKHKINSGVSKIASVGQIQEWNDQEYTTYWNDGESKCNKIQGTDSTIYPPHSDKDKIFTVFNTDICRTVELEFNKEVTYKEIDGYRSSIKQSTLTNDGDNSCYCIKKTRDLDGNLNCLPKGFADMYSCLGAPILLTFPHFLWSDQTYADTVEGLSPNELDHMTYVEMEPNTGSPLVGRKRVQFNIVLRSIKGIAVTSKISKAVLPIIWIEEGIDLSDKLVQKLKDDYLSKVPLVDIATWVLIGVGIAMFVGLAGLYAFRRKRASKK